MQVVIDILRQLLLRCNIFAYYFQNISDNKGEIFRIFNDRDLLEAYELSPTKDRLKIYTMTDTRIDSHQMAKEYEAAKYWTEIEINKMLAAKQEIHNLETELGNMM